VDGRGINGGGVESDDVPMFGMFFASSDAIATLLKKKMMRIAIIILKVILQSENSKVNFNQFNLIINVFYLNK